MAKNPTSLSSLSPLHSSPTPSTGIQAGRVTVVITDDTTDQEIYDNYGQWSSIGCIFFEKLDFLINLFIFFIITSTLS